jgi:toxin-antitoxin system PIN domain toxin
MRALLDVNVLIALLDPQHALHNRAHDWFSANRDAGWASCPIIENGAVRILSNPNYSKKRRFSPAEILNLLRAFALQSNHEFWPEDISLRDEKIFSQENLLSSALLTDVYLLGLAAKNDGRLITFDQNISLKAVLIAKPQNLSVL